MAIEAVTNEFYATSAAAKGGREGTVKSADGVIDLPLGKPGSTSNPKANPETLFAAGYAACFGGAVNAVAGQQGVDTSDSTVTATVHFGETASGFGLAVDLLADLPGVEPATAQQIIEKAHEMCPYSKATRGNIEVKVSLA